jgi:hypothetical protein
MLFLFFFVIISRCQFLSCTTEKGGKKKNRKSRFRAFPNKWNDLSKEHQEEIRRLLRKYFPKSTSCNKLFSFSEIPPDVQRCCTRCYEKLILQIRERQTNEEEDDDNDPLNQNSKHADGKNLFRFICYYNLLFRRME